ncbi:MAG: hypothetical protein ISR75_06480, partial [Phycisphaerales bacterium]|nr:hypothetical protein [Phycisphaerales bacterium]
DSGSAYVYRFDGSSWIETKLLASDGAYLDEFGGSVAVDGDTVVVGARLDDDNGSSSGSAYVYRFDGSMWVETKLLASDGASDDRFGYSVSVDGDTVVVGARYDDDNGSSSGSAYVYRLDEREYDCNSNGILDICDIEEDPSLDCDLDGLIDSCSIADGTVEDCNENGIPDTCELKDPANDQNNNGELDDCECVGDADGDELVNVVDLLIVVGYWGNNIPQGDLNQDGIVDVTDLLIVVGNWGPCE